MQFTQDKLAQPRGIWHHPAVRHTLAIRHLLGSVLCTTILQQCSSVGLVSFALSSHEAGIVIIAFLDALQH